MYLKVLLDALYMEPVKNANMIYFTEHYQVTDYKIVDGNIVLKGTSDKEWVYFSLNDSKGFLKLLPFIGEDDRNFAVISTYMKDILSKDKTIDWEMKCIRFVYPVEKIKPSLAYHQTIQFENQTFTMKRLQEIEAEYIYSNYTYDSYADIDYIRDRIEKDISIGVYHKKELVGWIMTHDDGSIGILHVLEQYRRKGLAKQMLLAIIQQKLEKKELPFLHIEEDNISSINLAKSCGFVEDEIVWWIGLEK